MKVTKELIEDMREGRIMGGVLSQKEEAAILATLDAVYAYAEAHEAPCPDPASHPEEFDAAMDRLTLAYDRLLATISLEGQEVEDSNDN